ncbi:Uncharacterised protein [uncultured Butyricicoccus sp.]|uniref:DUF2313 domain-containing protein n=2 Tax=Agathobaculum TaxID=2048137 RepID=A0ABT2U7G0_9FIRM|nr:MULTISPECIES: hypothetical protein [Agathobaculum]MCU6790462.1 hypothetical protein [Agathobaculum ammoniilyticum]SCJ63239.1 Uncharacterised protein [uncultured Butyricicoccus sp.]
MSFSDHKITAFQHKITDLPDQPSLPANELKARFDSSPEELRQAVNGICDEASRLEARVEGIVVDTFGDTIDREMLSEELAAELDAKATQTSLNTESEAREAAVSALDTRLTEVEAQKCEIYLGSYNGNGEKNTQAIRLGYQPKAVLVANARWIGNVDNPQRMELAMPDIAAYHLVVTSTGFEVKGMLNCTNTEDSVANPYRYIVFK